MLYKKTKNDTIKEETKMNVKERKMTLKNDIIFKMFFGKKENEKYLISFLKAVLNTNITKAEVQQEVGVLPIMKEGKTGRLDIKATIDGGKIVNIELQLRDNRDIKERTTLYGSMLLLEQLKRGDKYKKIKPVILINILNYNILDVPEYHTETVTVAKEHKDYEVINEVKYHFIELPKFRKSKPELENELECWLALIDSEDRRLIEMAKKKSEIIEEANDEIEKILSDEEIRALNLRLQLWEMDQESAKSYAYEQGENAGKIKGRAEGEARGKDIGEKEATIKIAKEMKSNGLDTETICKITKLSKEKIEKL